MENHHYQYTNILVDLEGINRVIVGVNWEIPLGEIFFDITGNDKELIEIDSLAQSFTL